MFDHMTEEQVAGRSQHQICDLPAGDVIILDDVELPRLVKEEARTIIFYSEKVVDLSYANPKFWSDWQW